MAARGLSSEARALDLARSPGAQLAQIPWATKLQPALPWAVCIGLTLAVYGSSLRAGIMFDAALDLPRATDRGWLDVLTNAGASPYYRPITLLLWKACFELLGRNDFVVLHSLLLASHAVCGWLVYQLGRRLIGFWPGIVAAALFVWFPLSYQVVGFVDSQFHSLATLFILAVVVLYWDARTHARWWLLPAALAAGGLALLTHESTAALLAPAVLGLELLLGKRGWRFPALFVFETLAFIGLWLIVPRWPSSLHLDLPSIRLNAAYFIQALGYPLTMQLGAWPRVGNDVAEVLLASIVVLVALLVIAAMRGRLQPSLFGLGWFALALAPAWLFLPWPNYVIDAPRLLYGASAGLALMWSIGLTNFGPKPLAFLRYLALLGVLGVSWSFLVARGQFLDRGATVVTQVLVTATKPGPQAGRVYVNVPAFVGPTQTDFLLGHDGVTMLPDYFGLDLEVAGATGDHLPITSLAYNDLAQPWDVAYGMQGQHMNLDQAAAAVNGGGGVYVSRFEPGQFRLEYAGKVEQGAAGGHSLARFGDWAALEAADARLQNHLLNVRLTWRALKPAPGDYTAFVHVIGDTPQPLIQNDGYAIAGLLPPRLWRPGSLIDDVRSINFPSGQTGKPVKVLVGLYDRAAPATRAVALSASGTPVPDNAVEIPLTVADAS